MGMRAKVVENIADMRRQELMQALIMNADYAKNP